MTSAPSSRTSRARESHPGHRARHNTIAEAVLTPEARQLYMAGFDRDRHDIEGILPTWKSGCSSSVEKSRSPRFQRLNQDWTSSTFSCDIARLVSP